MGRPKAIEVNGPYLAMMMSAGILSGGVPPANIYYAAGTAASTANLSDGSAIRPYQLFQFRVRLGERLIIPVLGAASTATPPQFY